MKTTIKQLKVGDFFRLNDFVEDVAVPESSVWVRAAYEPSVKKYSCCKYDDFNHEHFYKGDKVVYIGFDF